MTNTPPHNTPKRISDILAAGPPSFSFEFFPPKTPEGLVNLLKRADELASLHPSFVSVTYGAGGSTRDQTRNLVAQLQNEKNLNTAAHLTCVGHSKQELIEILDLYKQQNITNILALRGDPPTGDQAFTPHPQGLTYANELVELIRDQFGDHFSVAVAAYPEGHPETTSKITDLDNLKRKTDAGADAIVTQLFFDNRDFYDFSERCQLAHINQPIIAGIMPILSKPGILRMAGLCGSRLPAKLLKRLDKAGDNPDAVADVGIDWATQQCHDLIENGTRGIHFYTLNKSSTTLEIYRRLGANDSESLATLA